MKTDPDYRNSIKEAVSAVEAACKLVIDDPKATLGKALTKLEQRHQIHSALKHSFSSLYGYAGDGDGIRHALMEEKEVHQEDAILLLVTCSAFINYLIKKLIVNEKTVAPIDK